MTSLPALQQPASPSRTTPFSEPWLLSLSKAVGSINGKPVLMTGVSVTPQQSRALQGHVSRLRGLITAPADRQAVAVDLAKLLAVFPAQDQSDMPANLRMEGYFEALHGIPAWAVSEARARIVRGETTLDMRFAPTPPQFASVAKTLLEPLRRDLARLEVIARAVDDPPEPTAEERARVADGFAKLKAGFAIPDAPERSTFRKA